MLSNKFYEDALNKQEFGVFELSPMEWKVLSDIEEILRVCRSYPFLMLCSFSPCSQLTH